MTDYILVQTSLDLEDAGKSMAAVIVQQRLAACAWVSGTIQSTYWWQGAIEQAQKWVVQFRTRKELYDDLERAIKSAHSYETPEIIVTQIVAGSQAFLDCCSRAYGIHI